MAATSAATDLEQLSVVLGVRIDDFKKGMQDAVREFDREANDIERRNQQLTENMSRSMRQTAASTDFLVSALKRLFSVYAATQLLQAISNARTALVDLSKQAEDTRISVANISALRFEGAKNLVSHEEIDAALKAFTEISKAAPGSSEKIKEFEKALSNINPAMVQAFRSAPDQAARFEILARALASTTDSVKQAQLQVAAFGTDNERVLRTIVAAAGGFGELQAKAREAGAAIGDDLAKKAAEAQKQIDQLYETWTNKLKVALVELPQTIKSSFGEIPQFLQSVTDGFVNAAREVKAIAGFIQTIHQFVNQAANQNPLTTGGPAELEEVGGGPASRFRLRPGAHGRAGGSFGVTAGAFDTGPGPAFAGRDSLKDSTAKRDELDRAEKAIAKQTISLRSQAEALHKTGEEAAFLEAQTRLLETAQEAGIKVTAEKKAKIDELSAAYAKAVVELKVMQLQTDLAFERGQIGRTPDEQAIASRTRGLPEADAKRLGDEMRNIQNLTEGKEMAGSFVKGLVSDLENGVKAGQALENQLKRIAEKLADKAIDSLISGLFGAATGSGGFLSSVFHSQGGWAGQGPRAQVPLAAFIGAQQFAAGGGIPAILHAGEIVLNQAQQKNVAQGLGPGKTITITHAPTINGAGMTPDQVFAFVQRSQKEFARNIGPVLNDWQRRHG